MNLSRKKLAIFIGGAVAAGVAVLAIGVVLMIASRLNQQSRLQFKAMHAPPYAHSATITEETDRFNGSTTVNLHPMPISPEGDYEEPLELRAFFIKPQRPNIAPDAIVVTFYSTSKDWRFLKYHPLRVLADGTAIDMPPTIRDSEVIKGQAHEWISVDVPLETFMKIANAERVEARLAMTEMQLSSEHLEALRDLLSRAIDVEP